VSDDFYHDDPGEQETTRKFPSKILSSISLMVASLLYFQTTFAGNITLTSGSGIEFGQGFTQTVACSGSNTLTITPNSTFANASGAGGTHNFSSVTVSGIPVSCDGSQFQINAYGNSNQSPLALYNSTTTDIIVADIGNTFKLDTRALGITLTTNSASSFTLTFDSPVATSSSVFKLTIQSGANAIQTGYQLGDTGPGGGKIFYYSAAGFNCGTTYSATGSPSGGKCNYLEVAPSVWSGGADPFKYWEPNDTSFRTTTVASIPTETTVNNSSGAIGLGYKYTLAIFGQSSDTSTAAGAIRAYAPVVSGTTYSDWYLPTSAELNLMCQWQRGVTQNVTTACSGGTLNSGTGASGFIATTYWTSSQFNIDCAWAQNFGTGVQNILNTWKNNEGKVRPIRAF